MAAIALLRGAPPRSAPDASPAVLESSEAVGRPTERAPLFAGRAEQAAAGPGQPAPHDRAIPPAELPRAFERLEPGNPRFAEIEAVEHSFSAEPRDALSSATEASILDEIAQKARGLELVGLQVECRTTLCRLQMAFPESLAHKEFGVVPRDAPWTGKEPIGFFFAALDLEFRLDVGGLDESGAPFSLSYISKTPAPAP